MMEGINIQGCLMKQHQIRIHLRNICIRYLLIYDLFELNVTNAFEIHVRLKKIDFGIVCKL